MLPALELRGLRCEREGEACPLHGGETGTERSLPWPEGVLDEDGECPGLFLLCLSQPLLRKMHRK